MANVKVLRTAVWRMLLHRGARNEDLRYIIEFVESMRLDAARQLLARSPTTDDVRKIMEHVPSLRMKAQQVQWRNEKRQFLVDRMRKVIRSW
jgi:hypothetical protein